MHTAGVNNDPTDCDWRIMYCVKREPKTDKVHMFLDSACLCDEAKHPDYIFVHSGFRFKLLTCVECKRLSYLHFKGELGKILDE